MTQGCRSSGTGSGEPQRRERHSDDASARETNADENRKCPVDQEIVDAKKLAGESLKNFCRVAGLLIGRKNDDKNVPAALKVISGPKYATDIGKAAAYAR